MNLLQSVSWKMPLAGGEAEAVLYGAEQDLVEPIFRRLSQEALRLQRIFNFFDVHSELSQLNKERTIEASPELKEVLSFALPLCALSQGGYDITHGKNFLRRKRGETLLPLACSFRDIALKGNVVELLHPDAFVDLGSIAKGYIVDRLCLLLQDEGIESALVDVRGDMRIFGGETEILEIAHPRKGKGILPFRFSQKAVATSGDYRQFSGSYDKSHLLGHHDFSSVTILAETAMEADALATCAFVLERSQSIVFLEQRGNPAVLIGARGDILVMNGFEKLEVPS
ncbi:MAG: FAD:protein FMN transferase [Candidatus Aenigmarchaeota archaeon]|nr:FAD:protein FMN transferase [Candidatus Aenigmarchaeota archaeon]